MPNLELFRVFEILRYPVARCTENDEVYSEVNGVLSILVALEQSFKQGHRHNQPIDKFTLEAENSGKDHQSSGDANDAVKQDLVKIGLFGAIKQDHAR